MNRLRCWLSCGVLATVVSAVGEQDAVAQCANCVQPAYHVQCQTVYEERQVTAYRLVEETVCEQVQVTRRVPVWETQQRERRYTVTRPVFETSVREERYVVERPVWETQIRDCSYNRVRNVIETAEREQRYTVQWPVWETSEREECYTVMRQVTETVEQERRYTVLRPVTRYETRYVDQGCYVDQVSYVQSARARRGLTWMPAAPVVNPVTGTLQYQRPGLVWANVQAPPRQVVQKVWKPNLVACQVPVTEYCPQEIVQKIPVQVCRQVPEQVTRKVLLASVAIDDQAQVQTLTCGVQIRGVSGPVAGVEIEAVHTNTALERAQAQATFQVTSQAVIASGCPAPTIWWRGLPLLQQGHQYGCSIMPPHP